MQIFCWGHFCGDGKGLLQLLPNQGIGFLRNWHFWCRKKWKWKNWAKIFGGRSFVRGWCIMIPPLGLVPPFLFCFSRSLCYRLCSVFVFVLVFSCPEQLTRWPCPLVGWAVTTCGSLAAVLRGNWERMRKWRGKERGNGERKVSSFPHPLFPPSLSIPSFSLHFLHQNLSPFVAKCKNTALLSRMSQKS